MFHVTLHVELMSKNVIHRKNGIAISVDVSIKKMKKHYIRKK